MVIVRFTSHLQRHLAAPACEAAGATVREVLDAVLAANPALRGYVVDDQGRLRKHVAVFVDGRMVADRATLAEPVREGGEVFVMQALSGG